jgi:ABC-type cobalt transport system substrate-binding protein
VEYDFILEFVQVYRTGLIVGILFAVSAGVGGMIIHYAGKMFKMMGG